MTAKPNAKLNTRRKRQNGIETRQQIIDATKSLMALKHYESITLDQISDSVGVSKSSILWHFGSKVGVLTETILNLLEELENAVAPRIARLATTDERIVYLLESVAAYFTQNPQTKGVVISLIFNNELPSTIRRRILEHMKEDKHKLLKFLSSGDDSISEEKVAAIMALIYGGYIQWYVDGCTANLKERLIGSYEVMKLNRH